ncbi:MAG: HAD family hydrolase [Lachnospiraceae bacterium]|nr:HAD family hydrolase [Lachnospiraceae bacterium]
MKKYRAIFFDWDGTAVMSRKAPVEDAVSAMKPLLERGVKLAIISGTTYENIAGGTIEKYFTEKQLDNLYLGLGRGAYNYSFKDGTPVIFSHRIPDGDMLERIHRTCFDIHMELKNKYDFDTDIVFSRPNYCKIDLMVSSQRGDSLFMQADELQMLKEGLKTHGIEGGLGALISLSEEAGKKYGINAEPTCDAKYLEVGISSKSSNVDAILDRMYQESKIRAEECSFWGDEYVGIEDGIYGSDSFMCTEKTAPGDFFDVSELPGKRPSGVEQVGGGVNRFLEFLRGQAQKII